MVIELLILHLFKNIFSTGLLNYYCTQKVADSHCCDFGALALGIKRSEDIANGNKGIINVLQEKQNTREISFFSFY